jgi:transmembrane sensor
MEGPEAAGSVRKAGRIIAWHGRPWSLAGLGPLAAAAVVAIAIVLRRAPHTPAGGPATSRTYATAVGQRDSVTLADGSRIMLGPDSRLTVPSNYASRRTGGSRQVELRGDAYFDVRHDATQPFVVRVASAVIEDVGTSFTVESDDADTTRVAVVTGSVRLRADNAPATSGVILQAGDRGAVDRSGRASVMRRSVRADDTAWTTGQVVFRDASLARVAAEIRRWYGVQLHVTDSSLLNQHLNTSFNGEPVDQVLRKIGLMLGARVVRQGDTATLAPAHHSAVAR